MHIHLTPEELAELPLTECPGKVEFAQGQVSPTPCGNIAFRRVELLRRIDADKSPTKKIYHITVDVYQCIECGYLLEDMEIYPKPTLRATMAVKPE